ncbi:MAG: hypothetical protein PHD67_09595, partial [Oscillospiraceae bacterium]|nr:hypothetical protein [Oscillospiraceae bacterium]
RRFSPLSALKTSCHPRRGKRFMPFGKPLDAKEAASAVAVKDNEKTASKQEAVFCCRENSLPSPFFKPEGRVTAKAQL